MKFLPGFILLISFKLEAKSPDWFSDFMKTTPSCERELLCVVGEGKTLNEAMSEARSESAKFFQTKISSSATVNSSTKQSGITPVDGSFEEWASKTVKEEASEIISGLEVRRQEVLDGQTYVLMTLDRSKAAKILKEKMEALDAENLKAMELNSRFMYPKMLKNFALLAALSERYGLLSSMPMGLRVRKEDLLEKINKLGPLKMGMVSKGKKLPAKLSHTLIELLSPLKIVIVSKKFVPKYILHTEMILEDQYFKVEGFKKLNVILRLELQNSSAHVLGKMSTLSEQVARTDEQAIEKALPSIKESLQDNLDQLTTIKMDD